MIDAVANATGAAIGGAFCWWRRRLAASRWVRSDARERDYCA